MTKKKWMIGVGFLSIVIALSISPAVAADGPIKLGAMFISSGKVGDMANTLIRP